MKRILYLLLCVYCGCVMHTGAAAQARTIYTIAGIPSYGSGGEGGPATAAKLPGANGICLDKAGNIYFSDKAATAAQNLTA